MTATVSDGVQVAFSFKMLSDWQVSTGGVRQGALDSVVYRDHDGLPCLPFTTIRGIWRDSAELLAFALDDGTADGKWSQAVAGLFGDEPARKGYDPGELPRSSRLRVSDGRLPADVRQHLVGPSRSMLRDALTFTKPGVAIDKKTGLARDDMLRFDEVARKGLVLDGLITINFAGVEQECRESSMGLLQASFLMIEAIGGNRRRGSGRCSSSIGAYGSGEGRSDLLSLLKSLQGKSAPSISGVTPFAAAERKSTADEEFEVYDLDVELQAPTVIPDEVLGNVVTSLDYIPGTYLVAPITKILAEAGHVSSADIFGHVAAGNIIIEPAFPVLDGQRALRVPAIWHQYKDSAGGPNGKGKIVVKGAGVAPRLDSKHVLKSMGERFFVISPESGQLRLGTAKLGIFSRNTIDNERQRPEGAGGVFTYEHLEAGQLLRSRVRVRAGLNIRLPQDCGADVLIGRAKSTGYGHARIKLSHRKEESSAALSDAPVTYLFVESDLILPDGSNTALRLATALGLNKVDEVDLASSTLRYARLDGWSSNWNLPKPTSLAVAAGSVIAVKSAGSIGDALPLVLRDGAGLRRGEGYGRISLLAANVLEPPEVGCLVEPDRRETPSLRGGKGSTGELLEFIESVAIKEVIRQRAEQVGSDSKKREDFLGWKTVGAKTTASQLGNLRVLMGRFDSESREAAVQSYLNENGSSNEPDEKSWRGVARKIFARDASRLGELFPSDIFAGAVLTRKQDKVMADYRRYALLAFVHAAMKFHVRTVGE